MSDNVAKAAGKRVKGRRIVQLAAAPGGPEDNDTLLFALCDDGTVWRRWAVGSSGNTWRQLERIPQ